MSSLGQKRGSCGHAMASFDGHAFCARCRDKKKGEDPCVKSPESECKFCLVLTPEQLTHHLIDLKKRKERLRNWNQLLLRTVLLSTRPQWPS